MNANSLKRLLAGALLALALPHVCADEEHDLITTLQSGAAIPQKCAACQRLRVVGTANAVPALAALLGEERTSHAARYALEAMPCPEAGAALRQALERASGPVLLGLVDSVGWRRDSAAVPLLVPLLSREDATLASAAASALGKMDDPGAVEALVNTEQREAPAPVRAAALDALLSVAERSLAAGDARRATTVSDGLQRGSGTLPTHLRTAVWRSVARSRADARIQLVTRALVDADPAMRQAARQLVRELDDLPTIRACLDRWDALAEDSQLAVLDAARNMGAEALPTVRKASQSPQPTVRVAAWQMLGELGSAADIAALGTAAASGEAAERAAARNALTRLHGDGVRQALLEQVNRAAPPEKAELLRALGDRNDAAAAGVLVQNARGGPEPVRLAALESLRKLAMPDTLAPLLELAAESKSTAEREPVMRALFAICQTARDKDQTTREIVASMAHLPAGGRRNVLPLLSELATPAAWEAALAATHDADPELVRESVRVLSTWPNATPAPRLLELARADTDPTLRSLALRGGIEVAGQEPDLAKRLALLQQAKAAARSPEETKQTLGQIGQIPTAQALEAALAEVGDPALAHEAALAAMAIAEKLAEQQPQLAAEAAAKVLAQCKVPDIVRRAWTLRGKAADAGPFLRDWLVSGPYRQTGVTGATAVFASAFAPETAGAAVSWKPAPRADMIDLMGIFPGQENCVAYLKTEVIAPEECDAALLLGSDDGVKAWLNGAVVHNNNVDRGAVVDQDMAPIRLKKGANELLLKITQGGGGWATCARVVDSNGQPIPGLKTRAPQ